MKKVIAVMLLAVLMMSCFIPVTVSAEGNGRTVRVGWFNYAGVQEMVNGKPYGYNYDYLMEIAKYTGWNYEFVDANLSDCLSMLETGDIDLLGCMVYTEQRAEIYDFTDIEVGSTYTTLFTSQNSPISPYDFEAFDGMSVGIVHDSTNVSFLEDYAANNGFKFSTVEFENYPDMIEAAACGKIDASITSAYLADDTTKVIAEFAPIPYYFVTTKGNRDVLKELNNALSRLKIDNLYLEMELCKKFFPKSASVKLTAEEIAVVEASKVTPITVGIVDCCAPISFWDNETKSYSGITVELMEAVSKKTGLCFKYVPMDISRRAEAKVPIDTSPQLVACTLYNKNFADNRGWFRSESLLTDGFAVIGLQGTDISQGTGSKTLAVAEWMEMAVQYINTEMPDYQIKTYKTLDQCLDAVVDGEADAAVYLRICGNYIMQKPCYEKLIILPTYSEDVDLCITGFVDSTQLPISVINKGIRMMTSEERRSIELNYTVVNPYRATALDTIYKYRIPLALIVILFTALTVLFITFMIVKRRSEKRISDALALAEQASAAKGNFMSRMSHEIRTPLNAIIGYNTIARSELMDAKDDIERKHAEMKVMDCLTKSGIASKQLLMVINDVLDMSAIESGKIKIVNERFDFKGLISSLTAVFYAQAKVKGIEFDVRFDSHMEEWIIGDQMRINQVLTNLLSNAIKFTPDNGTVTLTIYPTTEEKNINIHFEVRDTGIGMEKEYIERIWNPFEQADSSISRRFGGTGLGLSISKMLVDLMDGTISCESKPGEGTAFLVDVSFERTEQPTGNDPYNFGDLRALVVDDNASTCDYIRLLLTRSGISSAAVTSGQAAISAVASAITENDPYNICIIDWQMPKMDGIETVKHIRKIAGNDLPIIIITAYDFSEVADKAEEAGVNMYLSKPLFQSSLMNTLANVSGKPDVVKQNTSHNYDFTGSVVLLAEDNTMNMEIARKILESAGLTVDNVTNGQEALDKFLSSPAGYYRAILMDVQMPVMDGNKAARAIRASDHPEAADIPIIAMTADAFAENISESLAAGMNGHISKPIDVENLYKTLSEYLYK